MTEAQKSPTKMQEIIAEVVTSEVTGKKWYYSKTFWANVLAVVAVAAQVKYGFMIPLEYQTLALSAINLGLRKISNGPIVW